MMIYNGTEVYGVIYLITNTVNGKVYVGQTVSWVRRLQAYKSLRCRGQAKLYNALVKHGLASFTFEVIDTAVDKTQLDLLEMLYIAKCNSVVTGYNLKDGGAKGLYSPESRAKMSHTAKTRPRDPALIAAVSAGNVGRKQSQAFVQARLGAKNPKAKAVVCVTTGVTYGCAIDAAKATGANQFAISMCCNHKRRVANKLQWRYA